MSQNPADPYRGSVPVGTPPQHQPHQPPPPGMPGGIPQQPVASPSAPPAGPPPAHPGLASPGYPAGPGYPGPGQGYPGPHPAYPAPAVAPEPSLTPFTPPPTVPDDATPERAAMARVRDEIAKVVVGQEAVVTGLVIALLCRGHVLLEGVPGVAKTLLIRALAGALDLESKRVQFTPDLMPGDVTGSLIFDARTAAFEFRRGPVFTNLLLADEINRTPPKTQSALLEVMEERQVTVDGVGRALPEPFLVAATQNPVEYEGTYPLPEAQLDRFLLKVNVRLPEREHELGVLRAHHEGFDPRNLAAAGLTAVATAEDLKAAHAAAMRVGIADVVLAYIVDLCRATRSAPSIELGASPRGATALLNAAKARAWLGGRDYVTPDDVKAVAGPALRHRIRLRHEAELEGATADSVLGSILLTVPTPR